VVGRFGTPDGPDPLQEIRTLPTPSPLGASDGLVFLACWAFFLLLRVLDEHKDHAEDLRHFPERALSRGLVTLRQLRCLGALALGFTLAMSLHADRGFGRSSRLWLLVMGYLSLMTVEFFSRAWLRRRPFVYALSHMAVMPLVFVWLAALGTRGGPLGPLVAGSASVAFLLGLCVELVRKTRGPEEERPDLDSYSRVFGVRRAPLVTLAVLLVGLTVEGALLRTAGAPFASVLALAVALLVASAALRAFRRAPSAAARKVAEGAVAAAVLVAYLALAAGLLGARGPA
jgi:4-hydroxybenzoate polyprenyltransferase